MVCLCTFRLQQCLTSNYPVPLCVLPERLQFLSACSDSLVCGTLFRLTEFEGWRDSLPILQKVLTISLLTIYLKGKCYLNCFYIQASLISVSLICYILNRPSSRKDDRMMLFYKDGRMVLPEGLLEHDVLPGIHKLNVASSFYTLCSSCWISVGCIRTLPGEMLCYCHLFRRWGQWCVSRRRLGGERGRWGGGRGWRWRNRKWRWVLYVQLLCSTHTHTCILCKRTCLVSGGSEDKEEESDGEDPGGTYGSDLDTDSEICHSWIGVLVTWQVFCMG